LHSYFKNELLVQLAIQLTGKNETAILDSVNSQIEGQKISSLDELSAYPNEIELRRALSKVSCKRSWFKTVTGGELVGET